MANTVHNIVSFLTHPSKILPNGAKNNTTAFRTMDAKIVKVAKAKKK